jgi:hypothetical protein
LYIITGAVGTFDLRFFVIFPERQKDCEFPVAVLTDIFISRHGLPPFRSFYSNDITLYLLMQFHSLFNPNRKQGHTKWCWSNDISLILSLSRKWPLSRHSGSSGIFLNPEGVRDEQVGVTNETFIPLCEPRLMKIPAESFREIGSLYASLRSESLRPSEKKDSFSATAKRTVRHTGSCHDLEFGETGGIKAGCFHPDSAPKRPNHRGPSLFYE